MQGRWIGTFTGSFIGDGILTEKGATYISKGTTEWVIPDRMTKWVWTVTKEGEKKPSTTHAGIVYWKESTKEVLGHCVSDDGLNWNEKMTKFGDVVERKRNSVIIRIINGGLISSNKAVTVRAVMISLTFKGATNKLVKFLLQISSRNSILKLMLERNKKS